MSSYASIGQRRFRHRTHGVNFSPDAIFPSLDSLVFIQDLSYKCHLRFMFKISLKLKWLCAGAISLVGAGIWISSKLDFQNKSVQACPFCQEEFLGSQEFYRNGGAIGVLTHKPAVPGHVLIIPERHVERFEELSGDEILAIGEMIKTVNGAIRQLYGTTGYDLVEKNGREAGQTVPHVHFHYLPRSEETGEFHFLIRYFLRPFLKPLSAEEMGKESARLNELLDSAALN